MEATPEKDERNKQMKEDIKTMSLNEVADKYGITRERVSQIVGRVRDIRPRFVHGKPRNQEVRE